MSLALMDHAGPGPHVEMVPDRSFQPGLRPQRGEEVLPAGEACASRTR